MSDIDYSIKDVEKLVQVDGTVKNVEVARLTAPGENFLSLVLRVDFEVEKNGSSKTISTVAKRLPLGERKSLDFNSKAMTNEIKWYTEIVPLIKNFANEQGIQNIDMFPEYCGSRYSLDPERQEADRDSVLLLKNLIPQGFKNEDRYKGFDLKTSKAIIKRMALFHSLPLIMKFKKPDDFRILKDYLENNLPKYPAPGDGPDKEKFSPPPGTLGPEDTLLETMINMPECAPYVSKLRPLIGVPKGPVQWHKEGIEPWNTIVHNDFWVNNIMVNPREGEEPLVKIVDFQMCTYGPYAKDLIFFLLTSVDNGVTKKYLDDLIKLYYDEFTSILDRGNIDVELTFTDFLKEIQRVAIESEFCHVLFFTTIVFGEKGTGIDAAIEEFNPFQHLIEMIKKMNQHQKDKLVLIASESAHRNWI